MTPRQAAEYRDELARCALTAKAKERARRAAAARRKQCKPKPQPLTTAERQLADRLLQNICPESVIDRDQHALGVARMLLNMGVRPALERAEREAA